MLERMRDTVLRVLRVPPEPEPPAGDPDSIRVFRAAPKYFRYKLLGWAAGQVGTLTGLVAASVAVGVVGGVFERWTTGLVVGVIGALAWVLYLAQLPFTLAALRLDYEMRWYMLSDRSLRIREGVFSVKEKTMTFANIQQIGVRQGPIQRLLDIANVEVRTAGGGSTGEGESGGDMHRGYFRGVADAESIRDTIRDRVRRRRGAGLGDPDEVPGAAPAAAGPGLPAGTYDRTLDAARELLEELRALRRSWTTAGT